MRIKTLQKEAYEHAKSKGFYDGFDKTDELHIASRLALIHSEVSEGLEALREGRYDLHFLHGKPEGMVTELADSVIRIADVCEALGLDLEFAISVKMEYNRKRGHKHGGKKL